MQWVCPGGKLPLSTRMADGYKKDFFALSTGRCKFGELMQPSSTCWREVWYPLDRELKQQQGKKDSQELKVNLWWEVFIPGSESPWLACIFWGHWFPRHVWQSPLKKSLHKMFYSTSEKPSTQSQCACFSEMLSIKKSSQNSADLKMHHTSANITSIMSD